VLHDSFQIPHKFIRQLSLQNRDRLLSALRARPSPSIDVGRGKRRRLLFAHIHHHHDLRHRVSTLASVLAFARNSGRIPVVIWRHSRSYATFHHLFEPNHASSSECPPLIIENLLAGQDGPYLHPESDANSTQSDWAELSLLENFYSDHAAKSNSAAMNEMLKSAAVGDQHISLSLSKPLISSYSSRSDSAQLAQSCLVGNIPDARAALASAFLPSLAKQSLHVNDNDAVFRMLHARFKIPYALLDGIRPVTRRILLDRLLAKEAQGNEAPRVAFIQPQYGLGNRLRAVGSMWAYARATDRVLVVIWSPDSHLDCTFADLFVGHDDVLVSDFFTPNEEFPFRENGRADKTMHHVKWYNYMKTHAKAAHHPSHRVNVPPTYHVYASSAYVIQSDETPGIIKTQSTLWHVLRELVVQIKVAHLVERAAGEFSSDEMIGVHIRSRTISTDVKGVGAKDYSLESAKQTDYWRKSTNVHVFLDEMRKYPDTQMFYVAADRSDVTEIFEREFPGRISYTARNCDSRSSECIQYAMADVLLLAKCKTLLGSYWSSFSELSCRWGGAKYRLAGADFGRPKESSPRQERARRKRRARRMKRVEKKKKKKKKVNNINKKKKATTKRRH